MRVIRWFGLLALVLIIAIVAPVLSSLRRVGYEVMRSAFAEQAIATSGDAHVASKAAIVYYPAGSREDAMVTLRDATAVLPKVEQIVGYRLQSPAIIFLEPSELGLSEAVNVSTEEILGAYYHGAVYVLSPAVWGRDLSTKLQAEIFDKEGPVSHELTHYVLDAEAEGNYPAWYTEGLAQFADKQITGYVWQTSQNSLATSHLYSLAQLSGQFYGLKNQALAYHEALGLVDTIAHRSGPSAIQALNRDLAAGQPFRKALMNATGLSGPELFDAMVKLSHSDPALFR